MAEPTTVQAGIFRELHAGVIRVRDFYGMLQWYTEVLELEPAKIMPDIQMAVLNLPGPSYLCLYKMGDDYNREETPKCLMNWRTDDIEETRNKLEAHGVECSHIMGGDHFKVFRFYDPEGTTHDCCWFDEVYLPEK
jgi:hypothetical protein